MTITIDPISYTANVYDKLLGYVGESDSRTITVENYAVDGANKYKLRFLYEDDVSYEVDLDNGTYTIERSLMRMPGIVKCQVLAVNQKDSSYTYIKKTQVFYLEIKRSVDDDTTPIPSYEESLSILDEIKNSANKILFGRGLLARVQTSTGAYRDTATTPKAGDTIYLRFVSCSSSSVKNLIAYGRTTDDTPFEPIGKINNENLPSQLYKFKLEKDYKYIQIGINPFNNTVSFEADYLLSDGSGVLPAIGDIQDKQVSIENQTCRIFRKVVCVGDSYTAGHIQTGDTQYTRNEMYAYPHYMELITGNEWVNCGASGTTVITWQTHQNGLAKAQKSGVAQAYVIGLGLNDSRNSAVPVGTADDIGTDNETYYGGLSKIVRELNAISPNAKIFINTCPKDDPERFDPYNEAVRTIASTYHDTYHTYCIDLAAVKDKYKIPSITDDTINGHQTAIGYHQFATIYNQILSDFINANISEFQDVYLLQADTFDERAQIVQNKADITDLKSNKVDKVDGKGLSTNDYTTADKAQIVQNKTDILSLQNGKVDKVSGKGLSTNDLTNDLKVNYDKAVEQAETNKADITILTERVDNDEKAISKINSDMVALHADNLALVFALQRTGKVYGVKAYKYPVNPTSTCEKTRDNAGLVCEPSTDTVEGVDDYADIPLFKYYHCNYKRYDDGFAYPTAFEGETDYQSSGDVDIGCLQMTFYYNEIETDEYVETLISDSPNDALGLKPWELSVRADSTIMPYFIQPKYNSVTGSDGLLHSTVGRIATFQSYGNMITNYQKKGTGYWGAGSSRYTFAQIFYRIKYGTKASDDNFMGVTNWNIQYKASVQSSDKHTYFPVTNAQASNLQVGLCVSVGYPNSSGNTDRNNTTMHAYANDVRITAIETLDDNNKAVYLDCEPFTTAPLDNGREIYMSSMHAHSGDTNSVIGHHDGSPISNTDGKHPFRLQGIEYALGAWLVASDTVMFFNTDYSKDVYVANGATHTANETTIKSTYTKIGTIPASANGNGSDYWTGDVAQIDGGWYPHNEATSTTGNKDNLWAGGKNTSGSREFLQGGCLWSGSNAGLCYLDCGHGLGAALWNYASAD